jgi:7-keto-8-aminopelargonate synthetase-like enzyme
VGAQIVVDGARYVNFGGSSYLGLAALPEILEAGCDALRQSGSGYQFPRHHGMATAAHQDVEREAADFFGTDVALYLPNGYAFGLVAIAALRDIFKAIFFDEWAHHALRDGIAASGLPGHAFRHLDAEDLDTKLKRHLPPGVRPLIVTDGLYSTLGEIAPLEALARVMAPYGGRLVVDESHSFGVLGKSGRGAIEHFGLAPSQVLSGGSTGKALGVLGGLLPSSQADFPALCATPAALGAAGGLPSAAAMCASTLRYLRSHPERLQRLRSNIIHLKSGLRKLGLDILDNMAPVTSFVFGSEESMRQLQSQLMADGIFVFYSTYIGAGACGVIRCGIFADHTPEHLDRLLDALRRRL